MPTAGISTRTTTHLNGYINNNNYYYYYCWIVCYYVAQLHTDIWKSLTSPFQLVYSCRFIISNIIYGNEWHQNLLCIKAPNGEFLLCIPNIELNVLNNLNANICLFFYNDSQCSPGLGWYSGCLRHIPSLVLVLSKKSSFAYDCLSCCVCCVCVCSRNLWVRLKTHFPSYYIMLVWLKLEMATKNAVLINFWYFFPLTRQFCILLMLLHVTMFKEYSGLGSRTHKIGFSFSTSAQQLSDCILVERQSDIYWGKNVCDCHGHERDSCTWIHAISQKKWGKSKLWVRKVCVSFPVGVDVPLHESPPSTSSHALTQIPHETVFTSFSSINGLSGKLYAVYAYAEWCGGFSTTGSAVRCMSAMCRMLTETTRQYT